VITGVGAVGGHEGCYVGEVGDRTKATDLWMEPADEVSFDTEVRELFPQAAWICSQPGRFVPGTVHLHPTLPEALSCGGTQAFLPLPVGSAPLNAVVLPGVQVGSHPSAAIVQYATSDHLASYLGGWFRSGRLALRWNELEVGPVLHEQLTNESRQIWAAMRRATRPVTLALSGGRIMKAQRFGAAALALAKQPEARLARSNVTGVTVVSG
jgi:hypothetical protein